jgi:hypothetical protein
MAWSRRRKWLLSITAALVLAMCLAALSKPDDEVGPEVRAACERVKIGMTPAEVKTAVYPGRPPVAGNAPSVFFKPKEWSFFMLETGGAGRGWFRVHFDGALRADDKRIGRRKSLIDQLCEWLGIRESDPYSHMWFLP